jgi:hypothetical protein
MKNKTEGVRILVQDVLRTIPKPYGEDIILNVFQKIKKDRDLQKRCDLIRYELGNDVVHNWIGKYTKELTGLKSIRTALAPKGFYIYSFTKLGH